MKTYEQFQDYLATQGIPHPISELGKQFALNELKYIHEDRIYPEDDLGKYEYRNMLSVEHAIDSIKSQIIGMTIDTDIMGRDQTQIRLKQLLRDNCKGLKWKLTKGYYLFYGNFLKDLEDSSSNSGNWFRCHSFSNYYDEHFPAIWQKRQLLDSNKTMRILKAAA